MYVSICVTGITASIFFSLCTTRKIDWNTVLSLIFYIFFNKKICHSYYSVLKFLFLITFIGGYERIAYFLCRTFLHLWQLYVTVNWNLDITISVSLLAKRRTLIYLTAWHFDKFNTWQIAGIETFSFGSLLATLI